MSLDSILENPSLKNMILDNAVSDYRGFLTGMSSNNFLTLLGPAEFQTEINAQYSSPPDENDLIESEEEDIRIVTSKILNTSIGAYYAKDLVLDGNNVEQSTKEQNATNIKFRETFVVLLEGQSLNSEPISAQMKSVILKEKDSVYDSATVSGVKTIDENDLDNLANMTNMIAEVKRDLRKKTVTTYVKKKKTVKRKDYVLSPEAYERNAALQADGLVQDVELGETNPDDYIEIEVVEEKEIKVAQKSTVEYGPISRETNKVNQSFKAPSLDKANLTAIVIKNPKYSMPTRNQNYLSVFFNAISQIDMSLATPYLEMVFFNIVDRYNTTGKSNNKLNQVAYMRLDQDNYMRMSRHVMVPASKDGEVVKNGEGFDISDYNSQRHVDSDHLVEAAYQNIFQSPQVLNNADINSVENMFGGYMENDEFKYYSAKTVLDPFAPMLSLNSFDVTVSEGGYYAVSSRRATMKLTLHDRSRLADITPFVTPGALQKTSVKITYGWTHPLSNPHSTQERNNIIANFIDSMRETAYYRLSSSNMRVEGSKVDIDVTLDFMGGREFRQIPAVVGQDTSIRDFKPIFEEAMEYISGKINKDLGKVHKNLVIIEKAFDSYTDVVKSSEVDNLTTILKNAKEEPANEDLKKDIFIQLLVILNIFPKSDIEKLTIDEIIKKIKDDDLSEKKIGVNYRNAKLDQRRFWERFDALCGDATNVMLTEEDSSELYKSYENKKFTADYFTSLSSMHYLHEKSKLELYENHPDIDKRSLTHIDYIINKVDSKKYPNGFISLGKLIQGLVAYPITTKNLYHEVQTVFYPVNSESAGARRHTTASLPISVDRLRQEFKNHIKEGTFMTPDVVFKILSNMLQNRDAVCYGLFRENEKIEKTLEEKFGYKLKDGVITLNQDGQKAAYNDFVIEFIGQNKSYPSLDEITGKTISTPNTSTSGTATNNEVDPRNYEQKMYQKFVDSFRKKEIVSVLKEYYEADGLDQIADPTSYKMINLKKDIETCTVLNPAFDKSIKSLGLDQASKDLIAKNYDPACRILRLHIYDAHLSPKNGLSFVSEQVTKSKTYIPIKGTLDSSDITKFQKDGHADDGQLFYKKTEKLVSSKASEMIVNMPPWLLKKYLKREFPSITYGASSSVVKSINFSSTTDNEIAVAKSYQSMEDQEEGKYSKFIVQQEMDLNIIPSTISLQMMGCPFLKICGNIYIDSGTNTDMDNVYSINSFSHSISAGKFITTANLSLPFAASTSNLRSSLAQSLLVSAKDVKEENN